MPLKMSHLNEGEKTHLLIRCPHKRTSFKNDHSLGAAGTQCLCEKRAEDRLVNTHSASRTKGFLYSQGHWDIASDEKLLFTAQHAFCSKRGRPKESSVLKDLWDIELPSLWGSNKEDYLYSSELFKILPPRNITSIFSLLFIDISMSSETVAYITKLASSNVNVEHPSN